MKNWTLPVGMALMGVAVILWTSDESAADESAYKEILANSEVPSLAPSENASPSSDYPSKDQDDVQGLGRNDRRYRVWD